MYRNVIAKSFRIRLLLIVILFLVTLILINTVFFYHSVDTRLGDTYVQKVAAASKFKTDLILRSLSIYGAFAVICLVGILAVTILYTHRIVGPLVSVRRISARMAERGLDATAHFRKKDAVHPLAEALNNLATNYRERHSSICAAIDDLYQDTCELSVLVRNGDTDAAEEKRMRMTKRAEEVNRLLSEIKV